MPEVPDSRSEKRQGGRNVPNRHERRALAGSGSAGMALRLRARGRRRLLVRINLWKNNRLCESEFLARFSL